MNRATLALIGVAVALGALILNVMDWVAAPAGGGRLFPAPIGHALGIVTPLALIALFLFLFVKFRKGDAS